MKTGTSLPLTGNRSHADRYLGTAAGCWHLFNDVLCREFSCFDPSVHRLTFDSHAVQHVGTESLHAVHSAALHLVGLCLSLDHQLPRSRSRGPSAPPGAITIVDVHAAGTLEEYVATVQDWAASAWTARENPHRHIRALVDAVGFSGR